MNLRKITSGDLRSKLTEGVIQFAFKKLDGTLRTAVGTTNLGSIPLDSHPKGVRDSPSSVVTFFDIEKREWRAVRTDQEVYLA
jgi:hypothetical protein